MLSIPHLEATLSRTCFVAGFMALALIFVPVSFDLGMDTLVAPCSYAAYLAAYILSSNGENFAPFLLAVFLVFYTVFFHTLARLSFWVIGRLSGRGMRWAQGFILAAVLSCSFIRSIRITDWGYNSGTYNFWEACARFAKTEGKLHPTLQ